MSLLRGVTQIELILECSYLVCIGLSARVIDKAKKHSKLGVHDRMADLEGH